MHRVDPRWPVFRVGRNAFYAAGQLATGAETVPEALIAHALDAEERLRAPFAPECLAVSLDNRCNLNCAYCYSRRAQAHELNLEAIRVAAERVAANCRRRALPFHLVIQGDGEPSLQQDAVQVIVEMTRALSGDWFGYVSTNGVTDEAEWLVRTFSRVSLSCDGPPDIQNAQRPRADGGTTAEAVAHTAAVILAAHGRLDIRATITPATLARQAEIVRFLREALGATHVRLEPAYGSLFVPAQAEAFVENYLAAEREARRLGVELSFSGVRLDEVHGPHCGVQTLRVNAVGEETACFRRSGVERREMRIPAACRECINVLHCARGCPDECVLEGAEPDGTSFRCLLHQGLTRAWIASLLPRRRMPEPLWKLRPFTDDGAKAWRELARATESARPLSIYVHVPFCDSRCGFCDCHAIVSRQGQRTYGALLGEEIGRWAEFPALRARPVTTVHFGGGTPGTLADLGEVVARLRGSFAVTEQTEWALESTSSRLADLDLLARLGFARLHVGVQTLDDVQRRRIGRREDAATVRVRLREALGRGFVTSADVLYGLPEQNEASLFETLSALVEDGVEGVSLYRLHISERNRRCFAGYEPDEERDYSLLEAAHAFLEQAGFGKNHFDHFARGRDGNLYATHASRGEDLLALGASADGIFGDYLYRHAPYGGTPVIEGGRRLTEAERRANPLQAALMAGQVPLVPEALLANWLERGLVRDGTLTARGCWLLSEMTEDVLSLVP